MAELAELENALRKADAAGNVDDARALANAIRQARQQQPKAAAPRKTAADQMAADRIEYDPTKGMSGGEKFFAGMGKSIYDTGRGLKSLFGGLSREEVDAQRKLDSSLMNSGAGIAGNVVGTVGQILIPGGAAARYGSMAPKVAAAVRSATLPTSIRGMALQGAAIGGSQQVGTGDSRLNQLLTGTGAAIFGGAIPKGLGALYRGTGSYVGKVTPKGAERRALNIIRGESERPNALLTPQPSQIPGVQRTLAEETLDPGIARLERNARSTGRGFDQLDRVNNAARVSAIRQFAGDEAGIAAAKQQRNAVAIPALEKAQQVKGVDTAPLLAEVDDMIESYTGNPAVQDGLKAARKEIAASGGDMRYMENARQYLGRLISGTANNNGAKLSELMDVKDSLVNTMGQASPDFTTYLNAYAQGSKPINRMQLGQSLLTSRSGSAILDPVTGEQVLTPAAFSGRARNLDKVAQEATQFKRAKAAAYLEPQDFTTIRNVQDDLERRSFAATAGSGGNSQTFERMALNDRVAGGLAGRIPIIGKVAEYLGQIGETRLQAKLGELLADPARFREGLARLPANDRRIIENAMSRIGGGAGALSPALSE